MKKLLAILLFIVISAGLVACKNPNANTDNPQINGNEPNNKPDTTPEEKTALDEIEEMLRLEYERITVDITTTTFEFELISRYEISESKISFYVERLNLLPEDGDLSGADQSYKSSVSGVADIENGKIVRVDGNDVALPEGSEFGGHFNFDAENLEIVTEEDGRILANVKSCDDFLGKETNAENMKIEVVFTESRVQSITLEYELNGSFVLAQYTFEE